MSATRCIFLLYSDIKDSELSRNNTIRVKVDSVNGPDGVLRSRQGLSRLNVIQKEAEPQYQNPRGVTMDLSGPDHVMCDGQIDNAFIRNTHSLYTAALSMISDYA